MKDKILPFIIGLLIGAILATGAFYIYENSKASNGAKTVNSQEDRRQMKGAGGNFDGQTPPDMPDGENNSNSNSNSKFTKKDKNNSNASTENNTAPEKPANTSEPNI